MQPPRDDSVSQVDAAIVARLSDGDWVGALSVIRERRAEAFVDHQEVARLFNGELYVRLLAGPDDALPEWVFMNQGALRWDAQQTSLNLKRITGRDIDAVEAILLWGGYIRGAGSGLLRAHPVERNELYSELLQRIYATSRTHSLIGLLLQRWARKRHRMMGWPLNLRLLWSPGMKFRSWQEEVYSRSWIARSGIDYVEFMRLGDVPGFNAFGRRHFGDLENSLRQRLNLPGVGEGWISQDRVLALLRAALGDARVIAEGRPAWLGAQRFDAWIPSCSAAVEYMGKQHFEPVEMFGGTDALANTKRLDERKRSLASENGIVVYDIRFDEDIEQRVSEILRHINVCR